MRLIDADEAKLALIASKAKHMAHNEILSADEDEIMGFLDHMKTVDAVPVIRCRECQHWHRDIPVKNLADNYGVCYRISSLMQYTQYAYTTDDFYCADGVRKDD